MLQKHMMRGKFRVLAVSAALVSALGPVAAADANDYVDTLPRVDLSTVYNAQNYYTYLYAAGAPSGGGFNLTDFTYGWFGVFPASGIQSLIRVGLLTDINGIHWAAESLNGHLTCPQGGFVQFHDPAYPAAQGCIGPYNSYVSLNQWEYAQIYYYNGLWNLVISAPNGYSSMVVGQVSGYGSSIDGAQESGEEGYTDAVDPYITMAFYHYHPKYVSGGAWFDWPASPSRGGPAGVNNTFDTTPLSECPSHYAGGLNINGDSRYWYTGVQASSCASASSPLVQF